MSTIFVQIASYRDPELLPTLRDCLKKAVHPQNLRFGLCWLRDESEDLAEFVSDPRFRMISIPYQDSQGVCWARHAIQSLYCGETYTLQLDSHHRFAHGWDATLIEMLRLVDADKPILTSYGPQYDPCHDGPWDDSPWKIAFDRFTPDRRVETRPQSIDNYRALEKPIPARFYSAHFAFASGRFCEEVRHDPLLYFLGEEMTRHDLPPPNPEFYGDGDWETRCKRDLEVTLPLPHTELSLLEDIDFWYVGAQDQSGVELVRQDLTLDRLRQLRAQHEPQVTLRYRSMSEAVSWTIWPHSRRRGWLDRITGQNRR